MSIPDCNFNIFGVRLFSNRSQKTSECGTNVLLPQPRSQGLSSLPPLVVGRKTLVAAGHVTTQKLGGKKICWVGGVVECFVWLM